MYIWDVKFLSDTIFTGFLLKFVTFTKFSFGKALKIFIFVCVSLSLSFSYTLDLSGLASNTLQ